MYSGEYDACDVTLSVYPHRACLKYMPDHGGNRTYDLWNTSSMLCQLSYAVWSVRVCGHQLSVLCTRNGSYILIEESYESYIYALLNLPSICQQKLGPKEAY